MRTSNRGRFSWLSRGAVALLVVAVLLALGAGGASAAPSWLPELWKVPEGAPAKGSGAGQIGNPLGVAVDPTSGNVYVADSFNSRIDVFTAWGEFVKSFGWKVNASSPQEELQVCTTATGCQAGSKGAGAGQLSRPEGMVVDSAGNLYVVDLENQRVQKFDDEGHVVLTFGGEVDKTTNANLCTAASGHVCGIGVTGTANGQFAPWPTVSLGAQLIAVGPSDKIYVGDQDRIQIFGSEGAYQSQLALPKEGEVPLGAPGGKGSAEALAVDGAGNVYFDFNQSYSKGLGGAERPGLFKHTATGWSLFANVEYPKALALDAEGELYAVRGPGANATNVSIAPRVLEFNAAGAKLIPSKAEEEDIDGDGHEAHPFAQKLDEYEITALATSDACNLESEDLFVGYFQIPTQSQLEAFGPQPDPSVCPPPVREPSIAEQFASAVEEEGATLKAKINSHFWVTTTYYLEYGTEPCELGGCTAVPAPPGTKLNSKSSNAVATKGVTLSGLTPGTTYHYRFVARTAFEPSPGGEAVVKGVGGKVGADGEEGEFTTLEGTLPPRVCAENQAFRSGLSSFLIDCRAYEMVSPVKKEGADIVALVNVTSFRAGHFQSAASGEKLTYSAYRPFGTGVVAAPYTSQYIASRGAGVGWSSEVISPPRGAPLIEPGIVNDTEYKAFTSDLCQGWLRLDFEQSEPVLDPAAPVGLSNLFSRQGCGAGAGGYEVLTNVSPPDRRVDAYAGLELQGTSASGEVAIFAAPGKLSADAPEQSTACVELEVGCFQNLYLARAAQPLRYLCYLPDGTLAGGDCKAGATHEFSGLGRRNQLAGALSENGQRVVFATGGSLYLRVNASEDQSAMSGSECSEAAKACSYLIGAGATFWGASPDGGRVIYQTAGGELREYLGPEEGSVQIAGAGVLGVLGQSRDARRVYFASTSVLSGANAQGKAPEAGEPNLYYHEAEGGSRLVGVLDPADVAPLPANRAAAISFEPIYRPTRVSGDGLAAAFVTKAPLTGFDNADAVSGEADAEVFRYDAGAAGGEGQLFCVSCDPSGARPSGRKLSKKPWEGVWAAAWIPTWEGDLYPSRALSEDGKRLFFNSFTPLVTRDTNGRQDVYEWEQAASKAACEAKGAERYVPAAAGCLSLISSGQGPEDSEFLDADPAGKDIFFASAESLLPQDPDQIDIYDAREGGGLPTPPPPAGECEGNACQGQSLPPSETTPASSQYEGPGNLPPEAKKPAGCSKGKHKVKKNGKTHCVKNKHKKKQKHAKQTGRAGR